jgi:hypothetical protein
MKPNAEIDDSSSETPMDSFSETQSELRNRKVDISGKPVQALNQIKEIKDHIKKKVVNSPYVQNVINLITAMQPLFDFLQKVSFLHN